MIAVADDIRLVPRIGLALATARDRLVLPGDLAGPADVETHQPVGFGVVGRIAVAQIVVAVGECIPLGGQ